MSGTPGVHELPGLGLPVDTAHRRAVVAFG